VYDFQYGAALQMGAINEGLIHIENFNNKGKWQKKFSQIYKEIILSDIILHDHILIPDDVGNSLLPNMPPEFRRLFSTYSPIHHRFGENNRLIINESEIRFAWQLKPFLLGRFISSVLRKTDEKDDFWEGENMLIALLERYRGTEKQILGFSDMYDFTLASLFESPNSALRYVRNHELRYLLGAGINQRQHRAPTVTGYRIIDTEIELANGATLWHDPFIEAIAYPCLAVDYATSFSLPIRSRCFDIKPMLSHNVPINQVMRSDSKTEAFQLLRLQLSKHFRLEPSPIDLHDALTMREHVGWKQFRELIDVYQKMILTGVAEENIVKEIVNDIQKVQNDLEKSKKAHSRSSALAYAALGITGLEVLLGIPSIAGIFMGGLSIVESLLEDKYRHAANWLAMFGAFR